LIFGKYVTKIIYVCGEQINILTMKANELMIGNYVYKLGKIHKLTASDIHRISIANKKNKRIVEFAPIPVTDELLLSIPNNVAILNQNKDRKFVYPQTFSLSTKDSFMAKLDKFGNDWYYRINGTGKDVKLVSFHQLQNLFLLISKDYLDLKPAR
jgi:hypothetical protein